MNNQTVTATAILLLTLLIFPTDASSDNFLEKLRKELDEVAAEVNNSKKAEAETDRGAKSAVVAKEAPSTKYAIKSVDTGPLGEWEIAGLRLGMTPEQVRTAIVTKYPYAKLMDEPCCLSTSNKKGLVGQFKAVGGKSHRYLYTLHAVIRPGGKDGGETFKFDVFFVMTEDAEGILRANPSLKLKDKREARSQQTARVGSVLFASEIHFAHQSGGKFSFNPKEFIRSRFGEFGEMGKGAQREVFGAPVFRGSPTHMTVRFSYRSGANEQNFPDSMIGSYVIEQSWTGTDAHIQELLAAKQRYMEGLQREHESKIKAADEPF